jgi:TonB dependent receptor
VSLPNSAHENYFTIRVDHKLSEKDGLAFSYFHDSGPQQQADPLGNAVHQVISSRQMISAEDTHLFSSSFVNVFRAGFSRTLADINLPVSGDAVASDSSLAITPGGTITPQIAVAGLTTALGLGGLNQNQHRSNSLQLYDDAFLARGSHSIKLGFAFERMQYNQFNRSSVNGQMKAYPTLAAFLSNAPDRLTARAIGIGQEVATRQSLFAGYVQDDWKVRPNLTLNLGLRYEMVTLPTNASPLPAFTVGSYTVAAAPIQEITTITGCTPGTTACGPVGVDTYIHSNPTKWNFEPRFGFAYDPAKSGKTAIRGGFAMFDVLPLGYVFSQNTAASSPFQISGVDPNAVLGTGKPDFNLSFNPQTVRNRFVEQNPKRADVLNWNINVQRQLATGLTLTVGYVGSRSIHLSQVSDDMNLVQPTLVSGVGYVFPINGLKLDPNWGTGAGIRGTVFDSSAHYNSLQTQLRKSLSHGVQAQGSYTYGRCYDRGSAAIAGDTYENSIGVPLLQQPSTRAGACDFDIRQIFIGNFIWQVPGVKSSSKLVAAVTGGWELGSIVTRTSGAPFTVTVGGGGDPLGTGSNGDFSMDFANLLPGCDPIRGGINYLNTGCFTPPVAPASLQTASASNPLGCAPNSFPKYTLPAPSGQQFCSNVLGNSGRNSLYGPGLVTWDMSLYRNFKVRKISELFNVQFRAEFFNILNHTNFLSPGFLNTFGQNNSVFNANGAVLPTALNQTSTSSRQIQFGLKLVW